MRKPTNPLNKIHIQQKLSKIYNQPKSIGLLIHTNSSVKPKISCLKKLMHLVIGLYAAMQVMDNRTTHCLPKVIASVCHLVTKWPQVNIIRNFISHLRIHRFRKEHWRSSTVVCKNNLGTWSSLATFSTDNHQEIQWLHAHLSLVLDAPERVSIGSRHMTLELG